MDFDDLLLNTVRLFRQEPEVLAQYQRRFGNLLVDEYQDINALQGALVDEMARDHKSLTCVGDDAQSIYSFRGADFQQIFRFQQRHKGAELMRLTINYRSCPEVLELANRSIAKNEDQHPKALTAMRPSGMSRARWSESPKADRAYSTGRAATSMPREKSSSVEVPM